MRGEGRITQVTENRSRICAQNYYGAQFNVTTQGSISGPGPDPGSSGGVSSQALQVIHEY